MDPFAPLTLSLDVVIRPCRREDLPTLEWFGLFAPHRNIILSAFESQERGDGVILVADVNSVASGQILIDLSRRDTDATGVFWGLRVFPCLQRLGIGSRLIAAAEHLLLGRGFDRVELTVDLMNRRARRVYERLGYRVVEESAAVSADLPAPDQLVYRKRLVAADPGPAVRERATGEGSAA